MRRTLFALLLTILPAAGESVTIDVLATTDMHGHLVGWDYYSGRPAARGLAKIATLIKQARAANPNSILIDNGDTIQGTPLEALHQSDVRDGKAERSDPMMAAMNKLGYAAMTVGNHEFNFGLRSLNRARDEARFSWLSGNTQAGGGARPFEGTILRVVGGVRVGIFGITTPNIPNWESPENYAGYTFRDGVEAAREMVLKLKREGAELIVGSVHAGLVPRNGMRFENMADAIAREVPGIDGIVFGHTHNDVRDLRVNGVLMVQPGRWAEWLGILTFHLERTTPGKRWKVTSKQGRLERANAKVPEDREILALAQPYHQATEKWLRTPVAEATVLLDGRLGRIEDTAIVDAVHQAQMHYAKADVSFTALFNTRLRIPKGPVTNRELAALYLYDNTLYAIEGTGETVKAALENSARYFSGCRESTCTTGPLINSSMPGYNFDMAQGVSYEVDISRPAGQRIQNLKFRGKPLRPEQRLRLAVNNYRAAGSNGYTMFKNSKIVWRSNREIRELLIDYYRERRELPTKPDNNWRIVPDAARRVLEAEAGR